MNWQIILLAVVVIALIAFCQKNGGVSNTFEKYYSLYRRWQLEQERKNKKEQIQKDIKRIQETNARASGRGKKINILEKNSVKTRFGESKEAVYEYVQFCERNNFTLEPDEEGLLDTIRETEDLLDPEKALDRDLQSAIDEYNAVYAEVNTSGENLLSVRQEAAELIDRIEEFINSIKRCPTTFSKEAKEIKVHQKKFRDALDFGKQQQKELKVSAEEIGAGLSVGAAVAGVAPSAMMWVATTFGTASTGTAISALSGIAAKNAALAWLGGGSLAAGGAGMAAGKALLALAGPVGLGIAGGSTVLGVLFLLRRNKKIQYEKAEEIRKIKNYTYELKTTKAEIDQIALETKELRRNLDYQLCEYKDLEDGDYRQFNDEQKEGLGALVNNTKSLAMLLSKVFSSEENNDNDKKGRFPFKK